MSQATLECTTLSNPEDGARELAALSIDPKGGGAQGSTAKVQMFPQLRKVHSLSLLHGIGSPTELVDCVDGGELELRVKNLGLRVITTVKGDVVKPHAAMRA